MTVNIYDSANQMERDLTKTQEFIALKEAYTTMKRDQAAFDTFKDFQGIQINLQQKQMQGQELTEDEMAHAREIATKAGDIEVIKNLMEKERVLNQLLTDLNNVITKPIQELYKN